MRRVWTSGWRRHVRLAQQQQRATGVYNSQRLFVAAPNASDTASGTVALAAAAAAAAALALGLTIDYASECEKSSNGPVVARLGRYVLYNEIGRGGFSVVRLAVDTKTDELLAAKIFNPKCASLEDIRAEIAILQHVGRHPHIVSLHDVLYLENETIMLTDLVQGGELFDYIVDMGSSSEIEASRMLRDVCEALAYIHSLGVCHRDLKPENVLLSRQSSDANIKLADFGLSRRMQIGQKALDQHPSGTIAYWAPEIIKRQPQDFGVDMWAFGVLAYITLTGVHPFDPKGDRSDAEIVAMIARGTYDVKNQWYQSLSTDTKDFLARLLDSNPSTRLTALEALNHSWLKGQTPSETPLAEGLADRLLSYQRLQQLRANILTVIMGAQHIKFENSPIASKKKLAFQPDTVNMDMFKEAFALFDKDESGDIDRSELEGVMKALGQQLSPSEIDGIMKQADADGDGKISFLEFVNLMNHRLFRRGELTSADLRAAFDIFDSNHDGVISATELDYMLRLLGNQKLSSGEIDKFIRAADVNGDGTIDFEEFCLLMRQGLGTKTK